MNEQSEPDQPTPYTDPAPIESGDTFCDAPMDDPAAAVRFAGCSINDELDSLGANTNV